MCIRDRVNVASALRKGNRDQCDVLRIHALPGNGRDERDADTGPGQFADRLRTVALQHDRGFNAGYLAESISDGP